MRQLQPKKRPSPPSKPVFFGGTSIYPKLAINTPNDAYEQQADAMANRVIRQEKEEENLQPESLSRQAESSGGYEAPPELAGQLARSKGGGAPLTEATQGRMSRAFGADFSDVRVHTGGQAAAMSQGIQAKAFTHGSDIYFNEGQYRPGTSEGGHLLAHELTHVMQQRKSNKGLIHRETTPAPAFSITQIPGIMTAMSWNTAAGLMNDWFSRPSHSDPLTGTPNTSAVSISWANGFSRSRSVYDALIADKIWVNSAAQELIKRRLISEGLPGPGASSTFGSVSASPAVLDNDYINYRAVSQGIMAPLDGLAGALANFVFRVAVQGTITDTGASPWYAIGTQRAYRVEIQQVAIYIRDSYDFIGDQSLGCWDPIANTVSRTGIGETNATCVGNVDFRNWRTENGRGGDFLIYSSPDILSTSDQFTFYE
ncbi:MAG: DUF4157 domain-containing protein [Phaeodactylibacter sp.]|nr:DUF4157 domain-containing protein [Phaeodactylibacter sp.]